MDYVTTKTYLGDMLHAASQILLVPTVVFLLAFLGYAVFCIGSVIVEGVTERRNFKVSMPAFLADLAAADQVDLPDVIAKSGLLNRQKIALLTLYDYRMLPDDALISLVKRLISEEDIYYGKILGRNNVAVRVAPMLGLMGTLIPLGPGIAALGTGDLASLSSSLIIAFDTTVAGLAAAAVCLIVSKIRKSWYENYMTALESGMATMVQKINDLVKEGRLTVEQPSDYAFLYQAALKRADASVPAVAPVPATD